MAGKSNPFALAKKGENPFAKKAPMKGGKPAPAATSAKGGGKR